MCRRFTIEWSSLRTLSFRVPYICFQIQSRAKRLKWWWRKVAVHRGLALKRNPPPSFRPTSVHAPYEFLTLKSGTLFLEVCFGQLGVPRSELPWRWRKVAMHGGLTFKRSFAGS